MSFEAYLGVGDSTVTVHLVGNLDDAAVPDFRSLVEQAAGLRPDRLVLRMDGLTSICAGALRCLAFAQQTMERTTDVIVVGARDQVEQTIRLAGLTGAVTLTEAVV